MYLPCGHHEVEVLILGIGLVLQLLQGLSAAKEFISNGAKGMPKPLHRIRYRSSESRQGCINMDSRKR